MHPHLFHGRGQCCGDLRELPPGIEWIMGTPDPQEGLVLRNGQGLRQTVVEFSRDPRALCFLELQERAGEAAFRLALLFEHMDPAGIQQQEDSRACRDGNGEEPPRGPERPAHENREACRVRPRGAGVARTHTEFILPPGQMRVANMPVGVRRLPSFVNAREHPLELRPPFIPETQRIELHRQRILGEGECCSVPGQHIPLRCHALDRDYRRALLPDKGLHIQP